MESVIAWIKDNWQAIFAIIGALYSTARLIVALTPSTKDDKAVGKVGAVIKMAATALGLDFKQGR